MKPSLFANMNPLFNLSIIPKWNRKIPLNLPMRRWDHEDTSLLKGRDLQHYLLAQPIRLSTKCVTSDIYVKVVTLLKIIYP
jgi:hypothetical protein